jgi:release factor glutamine methyltransferase
MKRDADVTLAQTVGEALAGARFLYTDDSPVTPPVAQAWLAHLLAKDRAWLLAHSEAPLDPECATQFAEGLRWLTDGEPLAYLTGEREFCGLAFTVTPDVLIPRPETEDLVDDILAWVARHKPNQPHIVDVGTGSGAIAITLAVRLAGARLVATDMSLPALQVARLNARRHQVQERVQFVRADLLAGFTGCFDVIAANLPYIASGVLPTVDAHRWEPALALDGGYDGLDLIRRLLAQAPARLNPGGLLILEIGYDQGERVAALCSEAFPGVAVEVHSDLAGLDRRVLVQA